MEPWQPWRDEVLEEARERSRPVVLYTKAAWCRWSREFEREVLSDPRVRATLESCFTPVEIDGERRPELAARYARVGWPSLSYLDGAGELLGCDGYLGVDELLARLDLVAGYWSEHEALRRRLREAHDREPQLSARGPRAPAEESALSDQILHDVAERLLASADPHFGGWGESQKFPHPEALDFLIARWSQTGDAALRQLVLRTLRGMEQGEIHDRVEGGFYRFCAAPDWSAPNHEKTLMSNAQRLGVYLDAHQAFGDASFARTANGIVDWLTHSLLDFGLGAFRGSQDADALYAHKRTVAERRERGAPACDPTIFADANAAAISALLRAAHVLERAECETLALRALDFLLEELWDERGGAHHYFDGARRLPGLLRDQAFVLRAVLDAVQYAGATERLADAERIVQACGRLLACEGGGYWDMPSNPSARGALQRRARPLADNALLAEGLLLLAHMSATPEPAQTAQRALRVLAGEYKRAGHEAARYARAVDLALRPPVHVVILGRATDRACQALRRAALSPYVTGRIVQTLDFERDRQWIERLGLGAEPAQPARALVSRGRESYALTSDPARLPALLARVEPAA